jgi:hypothetical protein
LTARALKPIAAVPALIAALAAPVIAAIPDEPTHHAIVDLLQARMRVPVLIVGPMAEKGIWILTRWDTGERNGKGEALAKFASGKWTIVRSVPGSMESARYLYLLGVPSAAAAALVKDIKKL